MNLINAALALWKATGGPFIGPRGGKWADPQHTIPWHPDAARRVKGADVRTGSAPLYHDPEHKAFVATHVPDRAYQPVSAMSGGEFATKWHEANHRPEGHEHHAIGDIHRAEIVKALREGREVSAAGAEEHELHHAIAPAPKKRTKAAAEASEGKRIAGGDTWWKAFGWKQSPGWDGAWVDTHTHDPARYDKAGVLWASKHMLRMRSLRQAGKVPRAALEAIALFAVTSIRTTAVAQERAWPKLDAWLAKGDSSDTAGLVEAMRPLGVQNNRAKAFARSQGAVDAYLEGMKRFGDHGPALRDWLMQHPALKDAGMSNAKISFTLELLGYSNVACIDARVIKHMTGASGEACSQIASKLSSNGALYAEFERALERSQSHRTSDPEAVRLGMAQWRMWDAEGGSDTTHKVLWDTMANVTGIKAFRKALASGSFDPGLFAAALEYHEARHGLAGPASLDIVPTLAQSADADLAKGSCGVVLGPPIEPNRRDFPFVASCEVQGIPIDIEQRKGDTREGIDADGTPWKVTMHAHYGEVRSHARGATATAGAKGMDGDRLDVYVGDDAFSPVVVVIDQRVPETSMRDEQKVMLGFSTVADAVACYEKQYTKPGFYGGHFVMSVDEFKAKIGDKSNAGEPLDEPLAKAGIGAGWLELPEVYAKVAMLAELMKGAGHRYWKRVPTGRYRVRRDGKQGAMIYRYFYNATAGGGIHAHEHMIEGAGFKSDGGHWHIAKADGDQIHIAHDETGESKWTTKAELSAKLAAENKAELDKHESEKASKRAALVEEVKQHGTDAHRKRVGLPTKEEEEAAEKRKADIERKRNELADAKKKAAEKVAAANDEKTKAPPKEAAPAEAPPVVAEEPKASEPKSSDGKIMPVGDHIWGSRKDLATKRFIESSADLENMSYADAALIVSKAKLVSPLSIADAKEWGLSPGTAHLFVSLLGLIRQKPDDSKMGRALYVDEIRSIQGAMTRVRSIEDFRGLLREMRQKRRNAPRYTVVDTVRLHESRERIGELKKDNPGVKYLVRPNYSTYRDEIMVEAPRPYDQLGARFVSVIEDKSSAAQKDFIESLKQAGRLDGLSPSGDGMERDQAWEWLEANTKQEKETVEKAPRKKREPNTDDGYSEAKEGAKREAVRVGGKETPGEASPERVKSTFNLREVDYGREGYMTQADRAYHTKALEGAMHDLADAVGLDPKLISFNGRLGVAMGARGKGGKHGSAAHYETGRAVINLTKFSGGGFLAHEWGHALDNIIAAHHIESDVGASKGDTYLTLTPEHSKLPGELSKHVRAVVDAMMTHPDPERAKREHAAKLTRLADAHSEVISQEKLIVREINALQSKPTPDKLEGAIKTREENLARLRKEYSELTGVRGRRTKAQERDIQWKADAIERVQNSLARLRSPDGVLTPADEARINALTAEHAALKKMGEGTYQALRIHERTPPTASDYYRRSFMLDSGKADGYWSSRHEMFARAFDTYVSAKLASSGRKNTYLSDADRVTMQPFPEKEEATKVHAAMDGLFAYLRGSGDLVKALQALWGDSTLFKALLRIGEKVR